jgi:SET domain-containing protein
MVQKTRPYIIRRSVTGLELFATEPIPKGKRIIEYTGPLISNEVVERSNGKYFLESIPSGQLTARAPQHRPLH